MRHFLSLLVLPVLGLLVASLPAAAADSPKTDAAPVHPARQTWEQRFAAANLSHNGHLTLEEAQGGYPGVAKHFKDIDVDHKGYVTEDDIRAWRVARKAAHRRAKSPTDLVHPAMQRADPDFRTIKVSQPASITPPASAPNAEK